MNDKDIKEIQAICLEKKAIASKLIDPASIVIAHWTRHKCQYGCQGYGKSLCCPPHSPTPDQTKKIIADYTIGLLIHFGSGAKISKTMAEIEREAFLKNHHKAIAFGAGPCRLCKECSLSECKFPEIARPSMEGCGMDVYATARNNDFPINVLTSKDEKRNWYGLLLIE